MTAQFKQGMGDWTQYRSMYNLSKSDEVDLHFGKRDAASVPYGETMDGVSDLVEANLHGARRRGVRYLMFVHGWSTSKPGRTTARSQVRQFMRSKTATPLIERKHCIQHETVFVAKLRPS